jgi:hypothetical protein
MSNCSCDCREELYELRRRLWIVEEMDRIRNELRKINHSKNFRDLIRDRSLKPQLEEIFGRPFWNIKSYYNELLTERNWICHRYTFNEKYVHFA